MVRDRFVFSMVHIVTNDLLERLHSGPPVPSFTRNLVLQTGSTMINAQTSMWIVVAGKLTPWGKTTEERLRRIQFHDMQLLPGKLAGDSHFSRENQ